MLYKVFTCFTRNEFPDFRNSFRSNFFENPGFLKNFILPGNHDKIKVKLIMTGVKK